MMLPEGETQSEAQRMNAISGDLPKLQVPLPGNPTLLCRDALQQRAGRCESGYSDHHPQGRWCDREAVMERHRL
jgi:hypothetical protein